MRTMISRLVLMVILLGSLLMLAAAPAAAHCIDNPAGWVTLAPGHFAAAGGHQSGIDHSGGTLLQDCTVLPGDPLNVAAPPNNPERI